MNRPVPLALTVLVTFFSALTALAVSGGNNAHAHGAENAVHEHQVRGPAVVTRKELALRNGMRELWEEHVTWTRLAVISLLDNSPDKNAAVARLLRNQTDIGDAIKPFYGKAAGSSLTRELRLHILIAADLISAAKAGDQVKVAKEQARWQRNAADIAALLSKVNPRYWKRAVLTSMLNAHLRFTTAEVVARLGRDWERDVAAYDRIHQHALGMADALATGIVKQFPRRFR